MSPGLAVVVPKACGVTPKLLRLMLEVEKPLASAFFFRIDVGILA